MWVNVAAHSEKSHEVDANVGGKRVTVCAAYWNIPCEHHSVCYSQARSKYDGINGVPATIFAAPDGKEIGRVVGGKSASELIKQQKDLLDKVPGDKISSDEWNQSKKMLEEAESHVAKTEWKKAIELFTRVSKMPRKPLKEKGAAGLERMNAKGQELIAEAKGKIESDKEGAKKILKMVAADFKPLACAKEATEALKEIPADEKK
jgi:hypothetical protein